MSLPQLIHNSATHHLKENYRGFHANKRPKGIANVPPLAQPIKPRFKKKSNSLLNKLIYSTKKEDDETATSGKESRSSSIISDEKRKSASLASSGSSRQKFRFSSFDSNLSTSSSSPPKDKKHWFPTPCRIHQRLLHPCQICQRYRLILISTKCTTLSSHLKPQPRLLAYQLRKQRKRLHQLPSKTGRPLKVGM